MEQNNNVMTEVTSLVRSWEEEHSQQSYDPVLTLTRFLEILKWLTVYYVNFVFIG